jgi:hypothetical protein
MVDECPDVCPLCGARPDNFVTSEQAEQDYRVTPKRVTDEVSQLLSVPALGLEHAAYRIETDQGPVWIDSPSVFNRDLDPVDAIIFTHRDFLGASNLYRELWGAEIHLHQLELAHRFAKGRVIDRPFKSDFARGSLEAFHIDGHTPGFTVYIHRNLLFVCDFVFMAGKRMRFNPYSGDMITAATRILEVIEGRELDKVCGYNYVAEYPEWRAELRRITAATEN